MLAPVLVERILLHRFLIVNSKMSYNWLQEMQFGSTTNEFKILFRNHKSSMVTKKRTCEVAIHFNKEPHALADFEFLVIEQLYNLRVKNNSLDDHLLTREAFWCAQLCTLTPHGLNKTYEFDSRNRIRYN